MFFIILILSICLITQSFIFRIYKKRVGIPIKKYYSQKNVNAWNFLVNKHFSKPETEKQKSAYLATLIHDLKSPTFAQIRTLKLLLSGAFGTLSKEQNEIIKETLNSENYLAEIVSNILTAYRCENNELQLYFCTFDFIEQVNRVCTDLKPLSNEKSQKINISTNCNLIHISADKLQLTRVINNLISNAIRYGFKNSTINITIKNDNKNLEFSVENKSIPIPSEKLSTIFKKYSNNGMGHYNSASTGLGLYLSKQIIEMHEGKIFAKSTENGMCTFGFTLDKSVICKPDNKDNKEKIMYYNN